LALTLAGCRSERDGQPGDAFAAAKRRVLLLQPATPRWERVARLEGRGGKTAPLEISPRALQWRVRWRCTSGRMTLSVGAGPPTGGARGESSCPTSDQTSWIQTGAVRLRLAATGRWSGVVEQQLDTALREPPLRAMRSPGARILARGAFYPIQSPGTGMASLYRLPTGRLALRLEDLRTSAYPDLFVWISKAPKPKTTEQAADMPHIQLGALKSTRGDQNYLLPKSLDIDAVGSVVIWWKRVGIAYTAATLE